MNGSGITSDTRLEWDSVAGIPVMCTGLQNFISAGGVLTARSCCPKLASYKMGEVLLGKLKINSLKERKITGRRELAEKLKRRRVNIAYVQETFCFGTKQYTYK